MIIRPMTTLQYKFNIASQQTLSIKLQTNLTQSKMLLHHILCHPKHQMQCTNMKLTYQNEYNLPHTEHINLFCH